MDTYSRADHRRRTRRPRLPYGVEVTKHILALDQGTTSSRAILFDHAGSIIAVAQKEFPQIFPKPGWVEHNASDIWSTQVGVAAEVLSKAHIGAADVAAI